MDKNFKEKGKLSNDTTTPGHACIFPQHTHTYTMHTFFLNLPLLIHLLQLQVATISTYILVVYQMAYHRVCNVYQEHELITFYMYLHLVFCKSCCIVSLLHNFLCFFLLTIPTQLNPEAMDEGVLETLAYTFIIIIDPIIL